MTDYQRLLYDISLLLTGAQEKLRDGAYSHPVEALAAVRNKCAAIIDKIDREGSSPALQ